MRLIATFVAIAIFGLLATYDVATTPTPEKGSCVLAKRVLLPDVCLNSCSPSFDCTATTRPYGFIFTQAATCSIGVVCLP